MSCENMAARFVWLGGWPQGLGPPGGRAEFLNLYGRDPGPGSRAFLVFFGAKKGRGLWGFGALAPFWGFGVFGLYSRPFWGHFGGFLG